MPSPSVTYTFANSTTADATQVNQNFTDLINGASDGTKDYSISALTVAGTATLNGNVTLGNSSGDDLTLTASLASDIAIKTTATYNIGGSTLGLLSVYFSGSGSFTTRFRGSASTGANYTFTLPTSGGTAGFVLKTDGSGTTSWESRLTYLRAAKTANYTATTSDEVLTCDASGGGFTITLPAAASSTNKVLKIIRTDQTLANAVTIDGNSSETINGATTIKLMTKYESVTLICDGSNWFILDRAIPSFSTDYTPTTTGFGTISAVDGHWQRIGHFIHCYGCFTAGTVAASAASIQLPTDLAMDTGIYDTANQYLVGNYGSSGQAAGPLTCQPTLSTTVVWFGGRFNQAESPLSNYNGNAIFSNSNVIVFWFKLPIANWEG